jgi:hypothetical protein
VVSIVTAAPLFILPLLDLRRHGTLLASDGPVFTGNPNHAPTYPSDLTDRLVGREVA